MKAEEKVIILLRYLHVHKIADPHDTNLREELGGLSPKQIGRDLRALKKHLDNNIAEIKEGKRIVFKLLKPIDILSELFKEEKLGLGMIFEMAKEGMPEVFDEFSDIAQRTNKAYLFFHTPFEDIKALEEDKNFRSLKNAVQRHEYRHIYLKGDITFKDVKPIKLLFSEGNWYIAYVDGEELRLSRISFIENVGYSSKNNYHAQDMEKYITWLKSKFQNPFSRYGKETKKAILYAKPNIAFYFREGMKRFFPTQRYLGETDDGGVRLSIEYTQDMEILPFIRRWMPDLFIEGPEDLKEKHLGILEKAIEMYKEKIPGSAES
jgi:predicted DNA-binding transcriptional regulator YafY